MINILQFNNYQDAAARTDMDTEDIDYYFMQLYIECHELNDYFTYGIDPEISRQEIKKELGDVLWFIFAIKRHYSMDSLWLEYKRTFYSQLLSESKQNEIALIQDTLRLIASFTNLHVKYKFHNHSLTTNYNNLEDLLMMIFANIMLLMFKLGMPFEEIAEINIEKLKKRYPNKFSTEASINRVENETPEARRERIFTEAVS